MFFANGYVEAEHQHQHQQNQQQQQQQHRRLPPYSSEESDILRELLLDGDFSSPRHFVLTPSKPLTSTGTTPSFAKRHHVEITIPQMICFDNSTLLRSTPSLLNRSLCMFPSPSPLSQQHLPSSSSSSVFNSIVSPPRVFIQDFAHLPRPFFHDSVSTAALESELHDTKPSQLLQLQQPSLLSTRAAAPSFHSSPCLLPPAPLPMLTMPPFKNKRAKVTPAQAPPTTSHDTTNSSSSNDDNSTSSSAMNAAMERKQLRCSYPECPNLRRSAGFCNRHSGKVCSVADCNKSALSRGKCPEHGGGSRCKKDGCFKFAQTRGLCKSHGGGRQCNIPGCTKNAHQNRLCRSHGGGKRCDFYGCPKWAQRSGYCCAHTKTGPSDSSLTHHSDDMDALSATSSPIGGALPMPSPTLVSPHHLLSMLP